jgi:hypothetical protein
MLTRPRLIAYTRLERPVWAKSSAVAPLWLELRHRPRTFRPPIGRQVSNRLQDGPPVVVRRESPSGIVALSTGKPNSCRLRGKARIQEYLRQIIDKNMTTYVSDHHYFFFSRFQKMNVLAIQPKIFGKQAASFQPADRGIPEVDAARIEMTVSCLMADDADFRASLVHCTKKLGNTIPKKPTIDIEAIYLALKPHPLFFSARTPPKE